MTKVRDALIREAIAYAPARGVLASTVPHCARFIRHCFAGLIEDWSGAVVGTVVRCQRCRATDLA
jgi:hypothetical protein